MDCCKGCCCEDQYEIISVTLRARTKELKPVRFLDLAEIVEEDFHLLRVQTDKGDDPDDIMRSLEEGSPWPYEGKMVHLSRLPLVYVRY